MLFRSAAFTSLLVTKTLHALTEQEVDRIDEIYRLWNVAYNAGTIRELAESFGIGLSMFCGLNRNFKTDNSTYVKAALAQVMGLCNQNRLRVTFDVDGPVFE